MKCLIVEDDKISSQVVEKIMSRYGSYHSVANGAEAVALFKGALEAKEPYDLVLMDIMIPEIDGLRSVLAIRSMEAQHEIPLRQRAKVIMTTALDDPRTIMKALYESDANSYLIKPIRLQAVEKELRELKLIP